MNEINYNGVNGVFLSNKEFTYIKSTIKSNNLLLIALLNSLNPDVSCFDFLLQKKF